ncbi:MAG: AMP-binding protein [Parabacteroides sp.]
MENRFLALIEQSIRNHWELPAFTDYPGATYLYKDVARRIEEIRLLLQAAGVQPGDKVALLGRNSSNWAICFFGVLAHGAVVVPILPDFKPDAIHHIINHSEAKALLVAQNSWKALDQQQIPHVQLVFQLDNWQVLHSIDPLPVSVSEQMPDLLRKKFKGELRSQDVKYHVENPDDLAVLNYTSGTTSRSKGVMIPYRSLWSNTQFAADHLPYIQAGDPIICMLPMAHMYGLAFEVLNSVNRGCHIHFLTRMPVPKVIAEAFVHIRPVLILSVPLIIEKIVKNRVFPELEKPVIKQALKLPVIRYFVRRQIAKKLEAAFGGRFHQIIIGGAALNQEVEQFLRSIHFRYTVGYGMTECGPLVAYAPWNEFQPGSVGRVVDRMEIRIEEPNAQGIGEVWVRGCNTMLGYYKNRESTEAVMMEDGWMRTGDLGRLTPDGSLYLCGRCKTMILGPNGQNIYPEEIEDKLNNLPYIADSLVLSRGDKIVALVYPDHDQLEKAGIAETDINQTIQQNLAPLNQAIPYYAKVGRIEVLDKPFEKTPKQSIKRYLYQ